MFTNKDFDLTIVTHTEPMDIGIYARDDYYFDYDDPVMQALMAGLDATTDPAKQTEILQAAQEQLAERLRQRLPVRAGQDRRGQRAASRACGRTRRPRPTT